ncbi:outer membrane beta-barrel protein [Mucilaginibacter sp. UYCu711]|uniref:outer membrane beta-barrel protein n=1 Tax=Mucilaginibacter sp. UYCu711 TaxID=3156339 RepID=UPI003D19FEA6
MSNQDQHLKLWQQKRSELHVDINPQADWSEMQHLLNTHMPVVTAAAGGSNLGTQLLSRLAKFKLLYVMAALLATGAITYLILQNRTAIKNNRPYKIKVRTDTLAKDSLLSSPADTASDIKGQQETLTDGALADREITNSSAVNDETKAGNTAGLNSAATGENPANLLADKTGRLNVNSNNANNTVAKNSIEKSNLNVPANGKNAAGLRVNKPDKLHVNSTGANNPIEKNNTAKANNNPANRNPTRPENTGNLTRNETGANSTRNLASGAAINNRIKLINSRHRGSLNSNGALNNLNNTGGHSQRSALGTDPLNRMKANQAGPDLLTFGRRQSLPLLFQSLATNNLPGALTANNLINNRAALSTNNSPLPAGSNKKTGPLIDKNAKPVKTKNQTKGTSALDWGILLGVNAPGSFTPKDQNKNIYGTLPIDAYTGLFATYNLNDKWAVNMQVKLLLPTIASGSYNHVYVTKGDTGQTIKQTYKINDSRKIYSAQVPVHLVYKVNNNISVKAGPVINLPIKQFNGVNSINAASSITDTTGYLNRLADTVNTTTFNKKLSLGVSGGIGLSVNRFLLEATYYRALQQYKISSPIGSYSSGANHVQITLGFKLNKTKPK